MRDSYDRVIDYARISITDRCNLRCVYCMPEEGVEKRSHADILSFDEIVRVCAALAGLGVTRLKITGGEPLVRKNAVELVARLKRLPGIANVTLTTNGTLLAPVAAALKDAGLDGVNISLDTLDAEEFSRLTRGGRLADALEGLDAALDAGFTAVKVNCVPMTDAPAQDVPALAGLAKDRPVHVRFIELMPIGRGAELEAVGREGVAAALERTYGPLTPCDGPFGNGPARYFSLPGFCGRIGFINTHDHGICGRCNRVRLTSEGVLKTCLHMDAGIALRPALQLGDDALRGEIRRAIAMKPAHHEFAAPDAVGAEKRHMSEIGG